jgi:hypothetical protein
MKNLITLLLLFALYGATSQNGFTTYSTTITSGSSPSFENAVYIDNTGNKWVGFGSVSPSAVAFGVYTNSTSAWTLWSKSTTTVIPSNKVNAITQDNSGNMWIGTSAGLLKYDGTTFTAYTTASGLPSNVINCLDFNAASNMLYVGTSLGLSRYDGISFTNYNVANTLLPVNAITDIKIETPNDIWITSGANLVHFLINSSFTTTSYNTIFIGFTTYRLYIDAIGNKWFTTNGGVTMYDNTTVWWFSTLYPNFTGATMNTNVSLVKGPNNGVLTIGAVSSPSVSNCLVELMSAGTYSIYFPTSNIKLTSLIANGPANITAVSGSVAVTSSTYTPSVYTFSYGAFSPVKAFGLGPGIHQNNYKYLDANRVKAGIMNRGDMWWDLGGTGNASYEVPKGSVPGGGVHGGFAAGIWMGGLDASNQLHTSAQTYRQAGSDYAPGPLDTTTAFIDTTTAYNYDYIWKIDYNDINTFITQWNLGNVPLTYTPVPDILNWPATGTGSKTRNMAPFVDVNNNGIYDPLVGGDYPKIKGDQALYYIYNDNLWPHGESKGLPFGVEVHAMAYSYGCPTILNGKNELAYTTFYDYKIYNRSNNNYHDVYVGFWTDVDVGCYTNDYIGSSVVDNLGFCYNSTGTDPNCGAVGYQNYPPAAGTTVLKGPLAPLLDGIDNDHDNIIDEAGEECLMSIFDYYNNNVGPFPLPTTNPYTQYHFYNILQGNWRDSTIITCGGTGYGGTTQTKYVYPQTNYPGNPCGTWTEITAGNLAGDKRYVASSGPFSLPSKGMTEVEYAYVWSVDSTAPNQNIGAITKLISDVQKVRSFYTSPSSNCLLTIITNLNENILNSVINIYPNPASTILNIRSETAMNKTQIKISDVLGKSLLETKPGDLYNSSINIESLPSGVYFITITIENNSLVKKFVKQ